MIQLPQSRGTAPYMEDSPSPPPPTAISRLEVHATSQREGEDERDGQVPRHGQRKESSRRRRSRVKTNPRRGGRMASGNAVPPSYPTLQRPQRGTKLNVEPAVVDPAGNEQNTGVAQF
ncbi:uncharacterized protein Dmoj_GI14217 [Drosophila mojavensis]|uniref:Uncharacterized protein n=1 Tax=Drosophila mojavensis TaxID=7230 RepID=B4L9V7_DROMO|nr:uncharacterized protein Dmoj_GI14217 [Drosophila mojavensis]